MFGRIRRRRAERHKKKAQKELKKLQEAQKQPPEKELTFEEKVSQEQEKQKEQSQASKEQAKKEAEELFASPPEGLTSKQKQEMTSGAKTSIDQAVGSYARMISGKQGARGIRGGVVQGQQAAVAKQGTQALSEFQRGLSEMDRDLSMKKLAAKLALIEGASAQSIADKQAAVDWVLGQSLNKLNEELAKRTDKFYYKI